MLTLADVLEALTGVRIDAPPLLITEAVVDSRKVIPAAMFVALPGERFEGRDVLQAAFKRGAHVVMTQNEPNGGCEVIDLRGGGLPEGFSQPNPPVCLLVQQPLKALQQVARWWRRHLDHIRVTAITGKVGKSTSKELAADVLGRRYRVQKNPGTQDFAANLPLTLLRLGKGHERAVVEMDSRTPGEITALCELVQPQTGVITNMSAVTGQDDEPDAQTLCRAELVEALPPASQGGVAILNYDDPQVRAIAGKTQAQILSYGLTRDADLWADGIEGQGLEGIRFRLHHHHETLHLRVPLIGRHSVHTALRAAAVGLVEGLTWQEIITGLQQGNAQLRLAAVHTAQGALLLDDTYNASPESVLAALNLLSELEGRKIAVLGEIRELGPSEKKGYELVGRRVAEVANVLVTVGEKSKMIAEKAMVAGFSKAQAVSVPDVSEAIEILRQILRKGDVCLVKGADGRNMGRIVSALEANA